MFCEKCGKEIPKNAAGCVHCNGNQKEETESKKENGYSNSEKIIWTIVGTIFVIVVIVVSDGAKWSWQGGLVGWCYGMYSLWK